MRDRDNDDDGESGGLFFFFGGSLNLIQLSPATQQHQITVIATATGTDILTHSGHCAKHFVWIIPFNPLNNPKREVLLLSPFYG